MECEWSNKVFTVTEQDFEPLALDMFRFQFDNNAVYRSFINALGIKPGSIHALENIPFLPISFFKTHEIKTGEFQAERVFESSGTTHTGNSRHWIKDLKIYSE